MTERPVLDRYLDSKTFRDFYYLKEELIDFCRNNSLPTSGGKMEIANRIAYFLDTGKILSAEAAKKRAAVISNFYEDTKVVLLISMAALLEVVCLSSKPIISLTVSDPITSADDKRKFAFIVEEGGAYELDVKLTASGYVTDIHILDHAQNVVYQNIAESISAKEIYH